MAQTLETLIVKLQADVSSLRTGLDQAVNASKNSANQVERSFGRINLSAAKLGTALVTGATAAAGAITALGAAAVAAGVKLGNYADKILDLEQQTGLTTDRLQQFEVVARTAGVPVDTLANQALGLTRRLRGAGEESKAFTDNLAALGINTKNANGELRSTDELLPEIIRSLAGIENITERNAIAFQVFGRQADQLAPVLALGADQIDRLNQSAFDLGQVLDRDALNAANNFRIEFENLKAEFGLANREIVEALLPALSSLAGFIRDNVLPVVSSLASAFATLINRFTTTKTDRLVGEYNNLKSAADEAAGANDLLNESLRETAEIAREAALVEATQEFNRAAGRVLELQLRIRNEEERIRSLRDAGEGTTVQRERARATESLARLINTLLPEAQAEYQRLLALTVQLSRPDAFQSGQETPAVSSVTSTPTVTTRPTSTTEGDKARRLPIPRPTLGVEPTTLPLPYTDVVGQLANIVSFNEELLQQSIVDTVARAARIAGTTLPQAIVDAITPQIESDAEAAARIAADTIAAQEGLRRTLDFTDRDLTTNFNDLSSSIRGVADETTTQAAIIAADTDAATQAANVRRTLLFNERQLIAPFAALPPTVRGIGENLQAQADAIRADTLAAVGAATVLQERFNQDVKDLDLTGVLLFENLPPAIRGVADSSVGAAESLDELRKQAEAIAADTAAAGGGRSMAPVQTNFRFGAVAPGIPISTPEGFISQDQAENIVTAGEVLENSILNAATGFIDGIVASVQGGSVEQAFQSLFNVLGTAVSNIVTSQLVANLGVSAATGNVVGALIGGLFALVGSGIARGGARQSEVEEAAATASARTPSAIRIDFTFNQQNSLGLIDDPNTRARLREVGTDAYKQFEDVLRRNLLPRLDALEGRVFT